MSATEQDEPDATSDGSGSNSNADASAAASPNGDGDGNGDEGDGGKDSPSASLAVDNSTSSPGDPNPDANVNEQFIERYEQLSIEMETKLRPDVVEAVLAKSSNVDGGSVDEDDDDDNEQDDEQRDVEESLTLSMLIDEQSERAEVLDDEVEEGQRTSHGDSNIDTSGGGGGSSKGIENAATNSTEIDQWIETVKQQNRERPSSTVYYEENMPDLQELATRIWSEEFADAALLGDGGTTIDPDLDLTMEEYAQVICSLLDVPVYEGSIIQSLHMVMSLFLEVENAERVRIFVA